MAAPAQVQYNFGSFSSVTSGSVTLSTGASGANVTAGNTLLAIATNVTTSSRQVNSFSDDQSNTWGIDQALGNTSYHTSIGSAESVASGATQITATWNFASTFSLCVVEIEPATYDTGDTNTDSTNDTNDHCSSAGITTASDVFIIAGGCRNAPVTASIPPSGWTEIFEDITSMSKDETAAYIESDSGVTSDTVTFTHTGSNRTWKGAVASYESTGSGGVTGSAWYLRLQEQAVTS